MNVEIITGYKVCEILPNTLKVEDEKSKIQKEIEVDQVVMAMGVQAYNPLEESLRKHFKDVFVIGDAAGYASLAEAVRGGFETAFVIESLVNKK